MSSKTGAQHSRQPKQPKVEGTRLAILKFYRRFYREHGIPPTIREVMTDTGVPSTSVVSYHQGRLVEAGYLKRVVVGNVSRGLVPVNRPLPKGKVTGAKHEQTSQDKGRPD